MSDLQAVVLGPPQSMGSKRAFIAGGKAVLVDQKSKELRSFQAEMRTQMSKMKPDRVSGPFYVEIIVWMQRPKSHFGTGKNADKLKSNAPTHCTTKPDADKIARAVLDCGTGIWWNDDAQIVKLTVLKLYAVENPSVVVNAWEV